MRTLRAVVTGAAMLLMVACAGTGTPIQHLQLSVGELEPAGSDTPVIVVDGIILPDYLLRDELLRREDAYRLHYDPFQRWAEPLDLGIQRVVAAHLESLLDTRQVIRFPDVARGGADWHLRIEVSHFEQSAGEVTLKAEGRWSRASDPSATSAIVNFEERQRLGAEDGSVTAAALSTLLRNFAHALADPITPELHNTDKLITDN